jgi:hypothetical protein
MTIKTAIATLALGAVRFDMAGFADHAAQSYDGWSTR